MPSFVIMESASRTGEATNAILCDPNAATGYPDKRSAVPVKATRVSEKAIRIDDGPRPRTIISAVGEKRHKHDFGQWHHRSPLESRTAGGASEGSSVVAATGGHHQAASGRRRGPGARDGSAWDAV